MNAYQIRGKYGGSSNIAFSENVGTISVLDGTDELSISGGKLKTFSAGADVANTSIGMADTINTINVGGTLRGTSSVQTLGPEGILYNLTTGHGLFADINASVGIGSIVVGTDLGSANISTIGTIDLISVGGSILGSATIAHSQNAGKTVGPFKKLSDLEVVGNVEAGATIRVKTLSKQHVGGVVNGNIIVGA